MNKIFAELTAIEGINGIVYLGKEGRILHKEFFQRAMATIDESIFADLADPGAVSDEMEFVFENGRIYLKKTEDGVLVLFLSGFAPVAMVRLQCDLIRAKLGNHNGKKRSRFLGVF